MNAVHCVDGEADVIFLICYLAYISHVAHADWNWSIALYGEEHKDILTQ